jgi:hypothetical protein
MNVFVAEHPMTTSQARPHPRLRRWLIGSLLVYPIWLILLGPVWGLDGRGALGFVPSRVRWIVYSPAAPIFRSRWISPLYESYVNWWYEDPNASETTP